MYIHILHRNVRKWTEFRSENIPLSCGICAHRGENISSPSNRLRVQKHSKTILILWNFEYRKLNEYWMLDVLSQKCYGVIPVIDSSFLGGVSIRNDRMKDTFCRRPNSTNPLVQKCVSWEIRYLCMLALTVYTYINLYDRKSYDEMEFWLNR